jgi:hypothetical protein
MLAIPASMRATEGGKPFTDPAWIVSRDWLKIKRPDWQEGRTLRK